MASGVALRLYDPLCGDVCTVWRVYGCACTVPRTDVMVGKAGQQSRPSVTSSNVSEQGCMHLVKHVI